MAISEFVQNAVIQLYGTLPANNPIGMSRLGLENSIDQFVAQLRNSGATVSLHHRDYYFSKAFGPVSERLRGKTRRQIRKSLAFLRVREYCNYNFRAKFGVAAHAALYLTKNDMIQLQLINQCRAAKLYIDAKDILSSFTQAEYLIEQLNQSDGYYVSGAKRLAHTPFNLVRNIPRLVVYVIKKEKQTRRTVF
jgi:hypothetical protein